MNPLKFLLYLLYERRLERLVKNGQAPGHIAVILDGNRRWARDHQVSIDQGHRRGFDNVVRMVNWCLDLGVRELTLYAFSTENFRRESEEVETLMDLLVDACGRFKEDPVIHDNHVRVRAIGRVGLLPDRVRTAIKELEERTESYDGFHLNIAVAYGGRAEILDAIKDLYLSVESGEIKIADITEADLGRFLYKEDMMDPDIIIRTSGEQRLSGFLLWQSAYSELYFEEAFFPAFRKIDLLRAVRTYQNRQRRFGR
jgi:tritrans,polycis-undecaprenyl-diphosphate synthase [geranylgeranyl-diphosphate specific]